MAEQNSLAARFEAERGRLGAVAYRMLGSRAEADDAVQEAWIRLSRADPDGVANFSAWLTTVVARVCLDMLRSRKARREDEIGEGAAEIASGEDVERDRALADSVGLALLVVLETLQPAERVAFVLHDMFDLPFDDIAKIVERTPDAARQLASRARRRVRGAEIAADPDRARRQEIVNAFLTASRIGDFNALLAVLDPNVVLRADAAALAMARQAGAGAFPIAAEISGAHAVAETFKGRAAAARVALVDGVIGAVYAPGAIPAVVFNISVENGRVTAIDLIADAARIAAMDVEIVS
jgi:RNA polymerase sigma factor (sigma-70 family)